MRGRVKARRTQQESRTALEEHARKLAQGCVRAARARRKMQVHSGLDVPPNGVRKRAKQLSPHSCPLVPIQRACAIEPRAHSDRKHQVAWAHLALRSLFSEAARNAGTARKAIYVGEPEHALGWPLEVARDTCKQPGVRLNRQEPGHVARREATALEQRAAAFHEQIARGIRSLRSEHGDR